jgi:hypothetical protein
MSHRFLFAHLFLFALIVSGASAGLPLSDREKGEVIAAARMALRDLVELWRDERYRDLYDYGTLRSQQRLSREEFEKRMKGASKRLQCCWAAIQEVRGEYKFATEVYIKAKIGYRPREIVFPHRKGSRPGMKIPGFEHETFLLTNQDGRWRINLYRILEKSGG